MSMQLSIYVGPYLVLPKDFQWYDWDQIVTDGRYEAGTDDEHLHLVPNVPLPGIDRLLRFSRYDETPVLPLADSDIQKELYEFRQLTALLRAKCYERKVPCEMLWGIVPCWS